MILILILKKEDRYHALIFDFSNNTIHNISFDRITTLQTSLSQCRDEILASFLLSNIRDRKTTEQISLADLNDFYGYNLVTIILTD
jgi:hypothetical protein